MRGIRVWARLLGLVRAVVEDVWMTADGAVIVAARPRARARARARYQAATDDQAFERDVRLELLVETARLWCSVGHRDRHGRFCIDAVTGPDEYSAVADNNVYTNLMAQQNLRPAAEAVERHPGRAAELGVAAGEAAAWRDAARDMLVLYDEDLGVHPQSAGFTDHQGWDFANTTCDHYPLLLHFPYVDLYRKQGRQAARPRARPAPARRCVHRRVQGAGLRLPRGPDRA